VPDESLLRQGRLCVVGNVNRDVKTAAFPGGAHLLRDGETSVARITETIGGGGANSACAAAALGAHVGFMGKIGSDALGARLEATLASNGVAPRLARDADVATGTSINLTYEDGQRHFVSSLPNNASLTFDDLDLGFLRGFAHLYRADVWFSDAMLDGGNTRLFHAARDMQLAISIDINWDPLWGRAPKKKIAARMRAIRNVLPLVDLVHGNIVELREFTNASDLDTALRRLTEWGAAAVVVHMGTVGAGYYENGTFTTEGPAPIRARVHATGTGDVLSVCMMLLHGARAVPVADKLRLSNRIVAEYIQGDRSLVPALS
jgi:sugar/nucleoside kinase (ribokinase family)